jgi:hypothetical protein
MIATRDVGHYAAQRLLDRDFSGKQTHELLGERDLLNLLLSVPENELEDEKVLVV